jgi:hypothetical protein
VFVAGVGLTATVLGLALFATWVQLRAHGPLGEAYVTTFSHARRPLEGVLAKGDGQAYAGVAQVADLSSAGGFTTKRHLSLRAARPLLSYLAWVAALGRRRWVPVGLAIVVVLSGGLGAVACGDLIERRGRGRWLGLAALLLPGAVVAERTLTAEVLGLGLAAAGILLYLDGRRGWAVVVFSLAGLARETYLLVPAALVVCEVAQRRPWRRIVPLVTPAVVWAAWVVVLHARLGLSILPLTSSGDMTSPFLGMRGFAHAFRTATLPHRLALGEGMASVAETIATVGVSIALVRRARRDDPLVWVAVLYMGLAVMLGPTSWEDWSAQARLLLPLYFFGLTVVLTSPTRARSLLVPPRTAAAV